MNALPPKGLGSRPKQGWLRDLDIRAKSKATIELCVQSQSKGAIYAIVCVAIISVSFLGRKGGHQVALWAAALSVLSAYRLYISVDMAKRLNDRQALRRWGGLTTIDLFLIGATWGAMPWLPFDRGDIGAWICVVMVPSAATWLAVSSLSAIPLALVSMTLPLTCSFTAFAMIRIDGLFGIILGLAIPTYMSLLMLGALATNGILVRERRLMHQLKVAAARSRNQADALSTAFARVAEAQNQLRVVNRQLETLATTDPLTGVANRRSFMEKLEAEYGLRSRYGGDFSVILLDLDHFKSINDRYGHLVGDLVLKSATQRVRAALRSTDILGRYGGEEFVMLLPQTRLLDARIVAERVRIELSARPIIVPEGEILLTGSLGVAEWRGANEDAGSVLGRADKMLYVAKSEGRNRVIADGPVAEGAAYG